MTTEPALGVIASGTHVFPIRVYWEDTDAGGVVYYANYLRFAERARSEMLRAVGIEQRALMESDGIVFAVRRCEVDYLRPARLDDTLEVVTGNIELEAASLWAEQVVRRGGDELVRMRLRLACVGAGGRPARLPIRLRAALAPLAKPDLTPSQARI
jgi:acyl-CoA thioester hydrolase